jgi:5-methyltetrahydrofolate--homocysteine methyltransferase
MDMLSEISEGLQAGDAARVAERTRAALDAGQPPVDILQRGLISGMNVVGARFKSHEIFLPDVLLAARAMVAGMDLLKPLLAGGDVPTAGKVVIGTVQGDLHDIGKNLVAIMLKGAGFEVVDLGHDVAPERFIDAAVRENADIIGMSALLTTTMPVMRKVVALAKERGLDRRARLIVGGAALSAEYAREIGADAYCFDGVSAVECARRIVGHSP